MRALSHTVPACRFSLTYVVFSCLLGNWTDFKSWCML